MMLMTLSTYAMGWFSFSGVSVVVFLLITALIKGGFIIRDFMELKGVSFLWRAIMYGWLCTVCFGIAICYMLGI